MRAILAIFVALLIASSSAASFNWAGNVSLTTQEQESFKLRSMAVGELDVGTLGYRGWFRSINIGASGVAGVSADVLWGEMISGLGVVPAAYISYWTGSVNLVPNTTIDYQASAAFIGGAFLGIVEVDPNGNVVKTVSFTGSLVGLAGIAWDTSDTGSNDGLNWATVKGTQVGKPWEIYITFLTTDKVGIVDKANTVVNPRSIETIVEIKNWNYGNNANHLVLKTAIATAAGNLDGQHKIVTGTGLGKVYGSLQTSAIVSGTSTSVTIKANLTADFSPLGAAADLIKNFVQAKYGSSARVAIFDVEFPAGSTDIVWDPTFGQGDELTAGNSAASLSIASFIVALVALLAMLL